MNAPRMREWAKRGDWSSIRGELNRLTDLEWIRFTEFLTGLGDQCGIPLGTSCLVRHGVMASCHDLVEAWIRTKGL